MLLITLSLTVLVDLSVAIGTGVLLGLLLQLKKSGVAPPDWDTPERYPRPILRPHDKAARGC